MPTSPSRRALLQSAALVPLAQVAAPTAAAQTATDPQWRNKQDGMAYRKLGRTGMMISEVVSGGDPIRLPNYKHLKLALDMGLNYLDMAPAYGNGECETTYGKFMKEFSVPRDRVFLTTKISAFGGTRNRMYKAIFDGLPGDKQAAIMKKVADVRRNNLGEKPGYFVEYYPGQGNQFPPTTLSNVMMADYATKVENSQEFQRIITESIDTSLQRVGTDHFDIVMCPHGACFTDELENPHIHETFLSLRKAGKVRFLGVSTHNDPAAVLRKAAQLGRYDVAMVAYNVVNGGYMDQAIAEAAAKGMGIIAMKAAHAVATHHKALQPVPQWRVEKVNRIVPGDMKSPLKAYMWALQNPNISAVISNLWDETHVRENLGIVGKAVELQPA